jgi:hypothetical protein
MNKRRAFIRNAAIGGAATFGLASTGLASPMDLLSINGISETGKLNIESYLQGREYKPLETIKVNASLKGIFKVRDGKGKIYQSSSKPDVALSFMIGGTLGFHTVTLENEKGQILDTIAFKVQSKTEIQDKNGVYKELLDTVYWSLIGEWAEMNNIRYNNRFYKVFVIWLRDHTHTMKAMKYFNPTLKDGFDLYADSQREDGLIWDNMYERSPEPNWWESSLKKGDFIRVVEDRKYEFKRQPVEADMEYLFVECLYYTWKATGDTYWMSKGVDKAIKALNYSMTDRYRWSEKYKLIKRGFTIDTWDFVHDYDASQTGYGSAQCIDPDRNDFGIMHGDNTGTIAAFNYLAEMLNVLGRADEAKKYLQLSKEFKERLDKISWNGKFYTHFVPEPEDFWKKRDIGKTDPSKQVSLSNAYALNRGITHEQAVSIIKTYLDIKNNLPTGSPGEWYTIYPIFENGYGHDNGFYEYMNGGVITIVAGELAHGAFEHGYEEYGADILKRINDIGNKHGKYLNCTYKGAKIDRPATNFTTLSLKSIANADFNGKGAVGVPGWSGEGEENDMKNMPVGKQTFRDIPFDVTDPATNGRKGALIISNDKNYTSKGILKVGAKAKTIYLLQARSRNSMVGYATLVYTDGTSYTDYMLDGKIDNWWYPADRANWKVAFGVPNSKSLRVGMGIYGLSNPNPEKTIAAIEFELLKDNKEKWYIGGVTLSDHAPYFDAGDVSFGIPDRWGAAAVGYGLIEGLAGVKDIGLAFDKVRFAPRWVAANETEASATIKYEASGGYLSYNYKLSDSNLEILCTGSGDTVEAELLLPKAKKALSLKLNDKDTSFTSKKIENSEYVSFIFSPSGVNRISLKFS